jgi:RHS repeat-associated protein
VDDQPGSADALAATGPIDGSPEQSTDVSTRIATGCGYDSYTGSVRRTVVDLAVPAAIGSHGLNLIRTYSSMTPWASGWSFYPGWRMEGKPFSGDGYIVYFPDGRVAKFKPPRSTQTGETAWRAAAGTNERLFLQSTNQYVGTADLWLEDGTRVHFDRSTELSNNDQYPIDYFTLAYWADPYGQITTFSYEQIPGTFDLHDIRVKRVTDPSGRYLEYSYDAASGVFPSQVNASNGQWVRYTWMPWNSTVGRQLERADYSDGTFATYTYERVPIITSDGTPGTLPMLITAQDTRVVGPMRAIRYEYTPNPVKDFSGEIKAERHLADNAAVSTFSHNSGRTVTTDTRGDTRSRTFNLEKVGGTPLVMSKSDFKGRLEYFYYDANNYLRQFNNRRGYPTTYINEPILGKPTRITNPDQTYRLYSYSNTFKPYFVSSVRDENGWYSSYLRDGNNRIYEIDFPNGAVETYAYNGFGQVITRRRTNGVYDAYDHFEYDATGRLTKRWDPTPSSSYPPASTVPFTSYTYYTSADIWQWTDRIRTMTDQLGRVTVYEYDRGPDGTQCPGRGFVTKISYPADTHDGALPYGTFQSFGYDAYGNRTSVTDELGHTIRYEYDDYNRVTKVTNHLNQATTTSYALDWVNPFLQTAATIKYVVSPMNKNVVYDYDENLRKIDQVAALGTADEAWTLFELDEVGNLTKTTDPRFKVTTYGYDSRNRQTSAKNIELNETTTFGYDGVGNKTRETRPDGSFRSWDYDRMNRLWHVYEWRFTDPPSADQTTTYGRDLAGNVRTITDTKGISYSYDYDLKNLKISETYPADATGVSRSCGYHYDDAGNLDYLRNTANQNKHVLFDSRNRPRHTWWDGNVGPDIWTTYDAAGRMTETRTNGNETTVGFGYDDANRLLWEDQTVAGYSSRRVQHDRDSDGNAINTHIPNWYLIWQDYTQRNQLAHIRDGGQTPWFNFSYDVADNMTKRQAVYGGVNDSTNVPTQYYDPLNRPTMWENTGSADNAYARSWQQYDSSGRMTATWRDEQGSKGDRFAYNVRNQLTNSSFDADQVWTGNPQNPQRTVSYAVDPLNRQSVSDSAEAKPNGLSATYFNTIDLAGTAVLQSDAAVNFAWNGASPAPGIPGYWFSARWEGQVVPRYSQTYTFYTQSDDGVRLWVNGQLLIDNWTYHGWTENSGTITLTAGQMYSLRLEYFQGTGGAVAALLWSSSSQGKEVIPSSQLFAARPASGLQATYYDNIDFSGTKVVRIDPTINFNWGGGSPATPIGVDTFSASWEGQIVPRYSETYTFYAGSDDGVRLWINGQSIVNNWWDRGYTEGTGTITLVAGQAYNIRMDFYENGGGAAATLAWSSASQPKEIVPQSQLFIPSESGNYSANALNQYISVGGQGVGYDERFNLTSYNGATFTYDAQNRLMRGTKGGNTVDFTYDGLGRCLKRTTNGAAILFAYDGWKPLAEWAGDGAWWAYRIYGSGPDEVIWYYDSRIGSMRVHSDMHGNVISLLDWGGNGIEKYTYDAFGKPKITDWSGNIRTESAYRNRFTFQGREWIPELGIYDYRNRFYHPGIGRFLQIDSKGFEAGDMNLFRYCGDDPVDKTDPMGSQAAPSMRFYDQPLFPPNYYPVRTVVEKFSTVERPRIGTLIPTRVDWEVTRQDFRVSKITVPIYDKNGHFTGKREDRPKDAAYTESRISATQQGSHHFNIRWDFDLQFRLDVGPKWQAFIMAREPDHIHEIVGGARNSTYTQNGIIAAAKQGLPALQDRAESMRHNWTTSSGALDLFNRHTLRENGIDVPLNQ